MKLIASAIDRNNAPGAARQQHVGEPTRRCAYIETGEASRVDSKCLQGMVQLEPAT